MVTPRFVSTRTQSAVLGARAYVYGFPIVLMERSRALFTASASGAPSNTLVHLRGVPDHTFRAVVRPNQDTIYSMAFLDLRQGPLSLRLPGLVERRFVSFTLLDAWSNAFASLRPAPSPRGPETSASAFVIVGPRSAAPASLEHATLVRAPTDLVWVIGRVELLSNGDLPRVHEIQSGVQLGPLGGPAHDARFETNDGEASHDPAAEVRTMSATAFFAELCRLLETQPPPPDDARVLTSLARVGIAPGDFDASALSSHVRAGLDDGVRLGRRVMAFAQGALRARPGWGPGARVPLGDYGTHYLVRALVAHVGFGANQREEAVYLNAARDGVGRLLDASRRDYRLRFEPGGLPAVRAFWSVSLYGPDGFFVANPIGRHVLGSHDALPFDSDGALEIAVQRRPPPETCNWLPAPDGPFELTLRMYLPEPPVIAGAWTPPRLLSG
jgi:hypothetical protein